ncbi:hypothetical protein EGW08_019488 [Elysia chlorotica]|uniref:Uncharacterized protein n=1 Tax=Elysia chlorotica TaxID=188477 RepID=A0A3S1H5P8_ELYCH|nr:hypothetical protein EGW08_019488 [Elysia chlorotica]
MLPPIYNYSHRSCLPERPHTGHRHSRNIKPRVPNINLNRHSRNIKPRVPNINLNRHSRNIKPRVPNINLKARRTTRSITHQTQGAKHQPQGTKNYKKHHTSNPGCQTSISRHEELQEASHIKPRVPNINLKARRTTRSITHQTQGAKHQSQGTKNYKKHHTSNPGCQTSISRHEELQEASHIKPRVPNINLKARRTTRSITHQTQGAKHQSQGTKNYKKHHTSNPGCQTSISRHEELQEASHIKPRVPNINLKARRTTRSITHQTQGAKHQSQGTKNYKKHHTSNPGCQTSISRHEELQEASHIKPRVPNINLKARRTTRSITHQTQGAKHQSQGTKNYKKHHTSNPGCQTSISRHEELQEASHIKPRVPNINLKARRTTAQSQHQTQGAKHQSQQARSQQHQTQGAKHQSQGTKNYKKHHTSNPGCQTSISRHEELQEASQPLVYKLQKQHA